MEKKEERSHVQWTGNNFLEIYEWLIYRSITRNFSLTLKILDPGNPASMIEIEVFGFNLCLSVGDYIVKDSEDFYDVSTNVKSEP